jgi:predicted enzyme related to lactoylglutathione lyase
MATIPTGRFVWFDYVSKDEKKAQAFFGDLFHWKTRDVPTQKGSYTTIMLGDKMLGGYMQPVPDAPQHPHWLPHLQVTSAQDIANKVKSLGGKIVTQPAKLGEFGTMAIVTDPLGAVFSLWQPVKPEQAGGDYLGLDGAWVWNELYTEDPDASLTFYKTIGGFESETQKMGGGGPGPDRYEILKSDDKGRAGVMKMPGIPTMWMPYVKVANADATVERAKKLGGTIRMPGETIPNVGRLAVILDPLGAPLGILQPAPGM